jgi:hypothetical protein
MTMPIRVEAYTAGGILTGLIARTGPLRDALEGATEVTVESSHWLPLDGSGERPAGELRVAVDDLILVVPDEAAGAPVHAQWHDIDLDAGPYRVRGEMPTMPGFDPGRALARPTGEFVLLRDARIELIDRADGGEASANELLVNRYAVDRVEADLMLGFFFPGAAMTVITPPDEPVLPTFTPAVRSPEAGAPAPGSGPVDAAPLAATDDGAPAAETSQQPA